MNAAAPSRTPAPTATRVVQPGAPRAVTSKRSGIGRFTPGTTTGLRRMPEARPSGSVRSRVRARAEPLELGEVVLHEAALRRVVEVLAEELARGADREVGGLALELRARLAKSRVDLHLGLLDQLLPLLAGVLQDVGLETL